MNLNNELDLMLHHFYVIYRSYIVMVSFKHQELTRGTRREDEVAIRDASTELNRHVLVQALNDWCNVK